MDILFSIATGLGLRIICLTLTEPLTRLSPVIIGVWEGAISHLVLFQDPEQQQSSFDHFLAYGLRLVFDLILTQDPIRLLAVVLWTGISLWLCQYMDQQSIPQENIRRKRSRRDRAPATSSLPSHVRVYQTPRPQSDPLPQAVPSDPLLHAPTPPHEQPSTPPSFFLQGEEFEAIHLSPAPDQPSLALVDPPLSPPVLAQLEADDGEAQDNPAPFPTPPATFASPEAEKDLTGSARRLSTIVEASSVEEVPIVAMANLGAANTGAQVTLPERKEQDQNANGIRTTTVRSDTVPLPVPDPFSRQLRSRASAQASIVADSESATLISINPATAHKFLLRRHPEEEVLYDELQTPLNPVARAILDDDVDNIFTDNEMEDELRTPLNFTRQLDGPLSPLSPLLSVQVRLSDVQVGSSTKPPSGTQRASTIDATNARLARSSLLISSEADELDSLESDAESSMLSTAVPTELYTHGDDWRKKAWEEEKNFSDLRKQYDKALKELRVKDALMLKGQMAESDAKIKRLHEKAARRYYKARNKPGEVQIVDVHGLRVEEAVEMTEKALRNALSSGYGTLKVITGRGRHSKGKLPVLKFAVLRAMERQKIPCQPDPTNPGVLIVTLP